MFFHVKEMQYNAMPEKPDPVYARRLQELLGGKFGEMTVMMSYLFQSWNTRAPQKYKDMLLDIGTEEIAHVEMLATMITRLLDKTPINEQEAAASENAAVGAVMGGGSAADVIFAGMNPQHDIVNGAGSQAKDSMGVPWSGAYVTSSGNLLADFRWNLMAETQGNVQVGRLYNMTDDTGVRDMLSFMLARDIMHQNQWQAAIQELQADDLHDFFEPGNMPLDRIMMSQMHVFWNCSEGTESQEGAWASGPTPDGLGEFQYLTEPAPLSDDTGDKVPGDPLLYGTPPKPMPPTATGPNPREGQKIPADFDKDAVKKLAKAK